MMLGKWLVLAVLFVSFEVNATAYVKLTEKDHVGKDKKHWHQMKPGDDWGKHADDPKFETWTFDKHGSDLGKYCEPNGKPPVSAVPEVETYWLILVGFGLYGFSQRKRWFSKG